MSSQDKSPIDRDSQLFELVAECLDAQGENRRRTCERLASQFPEFADELQQFIQCQSELDEVVSPLLSLGTSLTDTAPGILDDSANLSGELPELPDYECVELVAQGGMGIVYKARHKHLGRVVAIKMIRSAEFATQAEIRKFQEEAQRAAQLDHPQIVPVYEIGDERGRPYFTMRLMEGGSLAERIQRGVMPIRDAAQMISQLARAVHHAHQRGILHRDLKPGNILFDKDNCCQIADFGLAQQIERDSEGRHSVAIVGTPMYMAPEQAKRTGSLTTAVDVYGLGAVLYEVLTGRAPFRADNQLNTLLEVIHREPTRPSSFNPDIDLDLETICLKCLEKEPERRYGSADALADDLDRWLRNEPILARRTSVLGRAMKWARRSPTTAAMAALSVVAITVCIGALIVTNAMITRETNEKSRALHERTEALDNLQALRVQEQRRSYFQSISLAEREIVAGNIARAEQILSECPSELRSWEWGYLHRMCHAELDSRPTQTEAVCLRIAPTNDRIFVGGGILGKPGTVTVFESAPGSAPRVMHIDDSAVTALALDSDGQRLAIVSGSTIKIVDLENGEVRAEFSGHRGSVHSVAISRDGQRVASAGTDRAVHIWNAATGQESLTLTGHSDTIWSVAFSPDGQRIASSSADRTVQIWNASTGESLQILKGHQGLVRSVEFSSDGRRLVSAAYDNTARAWDAVTGRERTVLTGHSGFVTRAVFSPDSQRIVTASIDGTLRVWDAESGETLLVLRGHNGAVWDVAWHHDGRQVVSVGADGTLKTWEGTQHGLPQALDNHARWIRRLNSSADGTRLAVLRDDQSLEVWSVTEDKKLCKFPNIYNLDTAFALSGDARLIAIPEWIRDVGWHVVVSNADTAQIARKVPTGKSRSKKVAMNKDGQFLAAASEEQSIHIWDTTNNEELCALAPQTKNILQLAINPNGRLLVAIVETEDKKLNRCVVWNTRTGAVITSLSTPDTELSFAPDGESLVTFGTSGAVSVWNANTGKLTRSVDRHRSIVRAVAFSADGDRLFAADDDGVVTIWDMQTGYEVLALRELKVPIDFLVFPDRQTLLGISRTGAARRWFAGEK